MSERLWAVEGLSLVAALSLALVLVPIALGGDLHVWMVVVVVLSALTVARRNESGLSVAALLAVVLAWPLAHPDPGSVWTPVTAVLVFCCHCSLAWQASAPPGARFGRAETNRWVGRQIAVAAVTFLVYGAVVGVRGLNLAGSVLAVAAALALLAVLVLLLRADILADETTSQTSEAHRFPQRRVEGTHWNVRTWRGRV